MIIKKVVLKIYNGDEYIMHYRADRTDILGQWLNSMAPIMAGPEKSQVPLTASITIY